MVSLLMMVALLFPFALIVIFILRPFWLSGLRPGSVRTTVATQLKPGRLTLSPTQKRMHKAKGVSIRDSASPRWGSVAAYASIRCPVCIQVVCSFCFPPSRVSCSPAVKPPVSFCDRPPFKSGPCFVYVSILMLKSACVDSWKPLKSVKMCWKLNVHRFFLEWRQFDVYNGNWFFVLNERGPYP